MAQASSVLIADDDDDIRSLVAIVLTNAGFEIRAVSGGLPALDASQPQVYVLDVRMPDLSGLEVCRRLKADDAICGPVLLISADCSAEDVAAAFAAGCDDFLPKPFRPKELVRRVDALLSRHAIAC